MKLVRTFVSNASYVPKYTSCPDEHVAELQRRLDDCTGLLVITGKLGSCYTATYPIVRRRRVHRERHSRLPVTGGWPIRYFQHSTDDISRVCPFGQVTQTVSS
jgi:hypothetical protein